MNNQSIAVWLLIVLAVTAANLPFINERLFGLIKLRQSPIKPPWVVTVEVVVLFVLTAAIGLAFEASLANPFPHGGTLITIGMCIFVVLGFPGFVYRYLLKRKLQTQSATLE